LDVAVGPSYHQCVYILCAKEAQLLAANAAAREAFEKPEPPKPYMPHLSLLYSGAAAVVRLGLGVGVGFGVGVGVGVGERSQV